MYISSDLQEEILTGSCQPSYWTEGGSHLHPHLVGPARGTSHWIMPAQLTMSAQLLNRRRMQEELLTGSCQHSYWTEGGSHLHPHLVGPARGTSHRIMPAQLTCKRNFSQDHASPVTEQKEDLVFIHISLDLQDELLTGSCQRSYWTEGGSRPHPYPRNRLWENFQSFFNHDFE